MNSLWGDPIVFEEPIKKTKKLLDKINNPQKPPEVVVEKTLKSKAVTIADKLVIIYDNVHRILGSYAANTVVISTKAQLHDYIDSAIANNIIAVDTETNNSLDPVTCKLMGLCIYTPGQRNAYVPVNHVNLDTEERLDWQLTESDIKEELSRLNDTTILMHNGKFDYEVIKCTCDIALHINWDTLIAAKLLDENEQDAGLKAQYIQKIDPSITKYDIEGLFTVPYQYVNPDLFALYAATDAFMTYQLYMWQKARMESADMKKVLNLFNTVEMPLVTVIAEMELQGMCVDLEYADRLSRKYHQKLDELNLELSDELEKLRPTIEAWRKTPEAQQRPNKKSKTVSVPLGGITYEYSANSAPSSDVTDWYVKDTQQHLTYTEVACLSLDEYLPSDIAGKSKSDQLSDPINLGSPAQLAILIYDVLKCPVVNKKSPRGTGEDELKEVEKKLNMPLFTLLNKRKALVKLTGTYIDTIPELAKNWPDGRIRTHFNQYGAATGRLSSSKPINFQNIPSHNKDIRLLFTAKTEYHDITSLDNVITIPETDEICKNGEWIKIQNIMVGDVIDILDDETNTKAKVVNIEYLNKNYVLALEVQQ